MKRIAEECKTAGVEVEFEKIKSGFVVIFHRPVSAIAGTKETVEKAREKTREKILRAVRERPEVTTAELAKAVGVTIRGVEWNLKKMKDAGLISRIGPDKGGRWAVRKP